MSPTILIVDDEQNIRDLLAGYLRRAGYEIATAADGHAALDLSLDEVREILSFRDQGEAPCPYVLHLLEEKIQQIERQIAGLWQLQRELRQLHTEAAALPPETLAAKGCICHIIENRQLERL